jgi:hypothetical protein
VILGCSKKYRFVLGNKVLFTVDFETVTHKDTKDHIFIEAINTSEANSHFGLKKHDYTDEAL